MVAGIIKELKVPNRSYYMVSDIMAQFDIREIAYGMIRTVRKECIDAGMLTKAYPYGRIPKRYFDKYWKISAVKKLLLDITEGEIITENEKSNLNGIIKTLDEVSRIIQSLKLWAEKNLE